MAWKLGGMDACCLVFVAWCLAPGAWYWCLVAVVAVAVVVVMVVVLVGVVMMVVVVVVELLVMEAERWRGKKWTAMSRVMRTV